MPWDCGNQAEWEREPEKAAAMGPQTWVKRCDDIGPCWLLSGRSAGVAGRIPATVMFFAASRSREGGRTGGSLIPPPPTFTPPPPWLRQRPPASGGQRWQPAQLAHRLDPFPSKASGAPGNDHILDIEHLMI
jgi:hypothetical protein